MAIDKQRGIGLLELMLSIAILTVMGIAATAFYGATKERRRIVEITAMTNEIYRAACIYIKKPDFSYESKDYDFMSDLINAGLLSDYYKKTPWKGEITVHIDNVASNNSGTVQPQISVQLQGLGSKAPGQLCQRISANLFPAGDLSASCDAREEGDDCAKCTDSYLEAIYNLYQ